MKLTWDQDDQARKNRTQKSFSQREIEEMDLKEYLASSDSEEGQDENLKAKYRALLNLGGKAGGKEKDEPAGDMEITFTSGLLNADGGEEKQEGREETTLEKYARKEKERMKRRKEAYLAKRKAAVGEVEDAANSGKGENEEQEGLGFDDPFFQDEAPIEKKKEKKKKDKEAKKREAAEVAAQRAELELLMMDDEDEKLAAEGKMKHFNMKEVIKAEKEKKLKSKKRRGKRATESEGVQDRFEVDVKDPRFAALYSQHEFAIDPTNPRFKQTTAMTKLLEEKRKRSQKKDDEGEDREQRHKKRKAESRAGNDVQRLVQSIKRKSGK